MKINVSQSYFLPGDFMSYVDQFGDFMSGDFMSGDFLTCILFYQLAGLNKNIKNNQC